ncbi:MAG: calcium/sodium antiporter [Hoeflea sp.]|uniref:calcium/sodium antiporter n=1 Tax=Hoeflea sp. TaxID=1940281 RepID=UPI001D39C4AC|nr:calcium/sodium antiporter [Hoeflea sp.]MBU4530127.1 calcium/sodium antiporter [Alphaproteobacteria bacterium]MBU4542588.1 calcium/sodium antiporter [Alphaproteobacteria bacterium]MBU4551269.1 calcium/sodium antiporter [Alphaproteobacteria bacterium]MBV1723092.1 calcium/sodium antiporter [Hoeflea sp.]MBV1760103.1 calcium/sodium antiporter [Hoeflea sp.]
MLINLAMLAAGLALLTFGADYLVRGAISLANRLGMPPLLIGLTVVGFGTSMPELLVSIKAALAGSPAIAIGNVVGSNTANILLILGVAAAISPIAARIPNLNRDLVMMLVAAVTMLGLGFYGIITFWVGLAMFLSLCAYLAWVTYTDRRSLTAEEADLVIKLAGWKEALFIAGGLGGLFIGASLLIDAATLIAREFGISEAVIGLTIVAVGTSLPELATSVVAAFRRHAEVALGNVVGSNIFNILGILGVTGMVTAVPVDPAMAGFDVPFMLVVSLALIALILIAGRISRLAGLGMLGVYVGYVIWLF